MSTATGPAPADTAPGDTAPADAAAPPIRRRRWSRRRRPAREAPASARSSRPGRNRSRRRRWPWILALVLAVALVAGAVYAVFFTPLLGVRQVTVTGVPDSVAARVQAAVAVPEGVPLARVDLDAVAASAGAVPEVESVEVSRAWPDEVVIAVQPRRTVAVTSANGQLWLLDSTGDPYLAVAAPPPGAVTVQLAAPGAGDPSTQAALTVLDSLSEEFRGQVVEVIARAAYDVEVRLGDGRIVLWGGPELSATKMQILPAVLKQPGTVYDISDPSLVSVR
jgi:cell division protein FtsQ